MARVAIIAVAAVLLIFFRGGASATGPGEVPFGEGDATFVPLIGEPPAWLTEEVRDRVFAAAERGMAYDFVTGRFVAAAALPSQVLIRPGTQIFPKLIFPGWCTAAFVFNQRSKISTAGHCTRVGDWVIALAAPSTVLAMGTTTARSNGGIGNDWALISIDPLWRTFTDPAAAFVGGPCGRVTSSSVSVPALKHVGHGAAVGSGGTPRAAVLERLRSSSFDAIGAAYSGDSGAPVLETTRTAVGTNPCAAGAAVGILTHGAVDAITGLVPFPFFSGTRITQIKATLDDATVLP